MEKRFIKRKRKKLLIIENYIEWKKLLEEYKLSFPFNKVEMTIVLNKEEFEKVQHIEFDFAVVDWRLDGHTGAYYFPKIKAKKKKVIITSEPALQETVDYCNDNGIDLYVKPIQDRHILYILGKKVNTEGLFHKE